MYGLIKEDLTLGVGPFVRINFEVPRNKVLRPGQIRDNGCHHKPIVVWQELVLGTLFIITSPLILHRKTTSTHYKFTLIQCDKMTFNWLKTTEVDVWMKGRLKKVDEQENS